MHDVLLIWVQVAIALGLALMETAWQPCVSLTAIIHSPPPPITATLPHCRNLGPWVALGQVWVFGVADLQCVCIYAQKIKLKV